MRRLSIVLFIVSLSACIPSGVFEKTNAFSNNRWYRKDKPGFKFYISDTVSSYKAYLYLRHTDAYPFSNIWVNLYTQVPEGRQPVSSKLELPLADEEGKWYARGMNEIREHKIPLNKNGAVHFSKTGYYEISVEQIMRLDPLPEVMSVGIILEKSTN